MTTTNQNLDVYRGDNVIVFIALTDDAGNVFDVSSASAIRYRAAKSAHAVNSEALIAKDMNSGISAAEGGINLTLDADDTDLPAALYYQELKIYGPTAGDVSTALTGSLVIRRSLTMGETQQASLRLVGQSGLTLTPP